MRVARGCGAFLLAATVVLSLAAGERASAISIDNVGLSSTSVAKYAKIELTVILSGVAATRFYDPDTTRGGLDLSATFTGPGGTWAVNGFFDGANWLVRFAPNAEGDWSFTVTARDSSGTATRSGGPFTCAASSYPGWPRIDGHYLRYSGGAALFAVGHNTGWQTDVEQPSLAGMAAKGENLLSFWLAAPWYKVSWGAAWAARTPIENVEQGIGNYNQAACAYLDGVVERAEAAGGYLLPTIWSHGQLRDVGHPWGEGWWWNNAYNSLGSATDFFQTGTSEQWRYQRNFYRYLIARYGHSRAIAGWVGVCELDGTTGYISNRSQAEAWCGAVRDYFRQNDPFRVNGSGAYPIAFTKTDFVSDWNTWSATFDTRSNDSYTSQDSNIAVALTIATETSTMRAAAMPSFHAEFGGRTTNGATQPTHLHNGIWAGAATGAAMTPLVWCDGGSFPMLSGAMQDHLQYLAQFMAGIDYLGNASLGAASVSINNTYFRGWGMKLADRGYAWVQRKTTGTVGGQVVSISGLVAGQYTVRWFDAWSNGSVPFQTATVVVSTDTVLRATIPTLARADIACSFARAVTNTPPVASAQSVTTPEDAPKAITLTATDADNNPLTYAVVTQPSHGTLSGVAPNVTYTPAANYNGPDSFTFKANDGTADSNVATVTITVSPVNDAPVANAQSVTTPEDTPRTITLTATDADNNPLTYAVVTQPSHGTLSGTAPNLTYTPAANYNGPDSFTFKANDGTADSNVASVTITVTAANDPPVADNQSVTTDEDTGVAIILAAADVDGDPLTYSVVAQPANGTLSGTAPNLTYTPSLNSNGADSFTFKANDGKADSNVATVTITVTAVNDLPVAIADSAITSQNVPVTVSVLANDSDVDGDTLTVAEVAHPTNGEADINPDNTVTYNPDPGFVGTDSFDYTVSDDHGGTATATVSVTVTSSANALPVARDDAVTTPEDTAVIIAVLANDTDADADPLTVTGLTEPAHGSAVINTDNTVTYSPAANYNGVDSFTYTVSDGRGGTATATVSVTVNPVNDAPVAVDDSYSTNEDTPLTVAAPGVLGNDTDVEGNALTAVLVAGPTTGSLTLNANGSFTYTPNPNFNGTDSFTYRANDGAADSNVATVSITVNAVNDAPVATNDTATTPQNTAVTVYVLANDADPDGDTLSVSAVTQGANGVVVKNGTTATYTPNPGYYGTDSFTYTASDGHGGTASATVAVTVTASALPDIYGRITNRSGGAGIAGITVTLTKNIGGTWGSPVTTTTNTQGYYTFSMLALATYRVTPSSTSWTFTPSYSQITISSSNNHVQADFKAKAR